MMNRKADAYLSKALAATKLSLSIKFGQKKWMRVCCLLILTSSWSLSSMAVSTPNVEQRIEFKELGGTLIFKLAPCSLGGGQTWQLKIDSEAGDRGRTLVCKMRDNGAVMVETIKFETLIPFTHPATLLKEMKQWSLGQSSFGAPQAEMEKPAKSSINSIQHSWGIEYFWNTPSSPSTRFDYFCPKKSKGCIRVKLNDHQNLTTVHFETY